MKTVLCSAFSSFCLISFCSSGDTASAIWLNPDCVLALNVSYTSGSANKERERTPVRQTIKRVAITDWSFREIRKLSNLSPSREQRHPDDVFVEVTRSFVVLHHACVMVQPLRQSRFLCFWIFAHFEASNNVQIKLGEPRHRIAWIHTKSERPSGVTIHHDVVVAAQQMGANHRDIARHATNGIVGPITARAKTVNQKPRGVLYGLHEKNPM